jgi:hypothetical protein
VGCITLEGLTGSQLCNFVLVGRRGPLAEKWPRPVISVNVKRQRALYPNRPHNQSTRQLQQEGPSIGDFHQLFPCGRNICKQTRHAARGNSAHVWIDSWELNVGDSLIDRIQNAIQDASALLVIVSKASVESESCKKELNAALVRELEEKKVIVLPVLKEDCNVPEFRRDWVPSRVVRSRVKPRKSAARRAE